MNKKNILPIIFVLLSVSIILFSFAVPTPPLELSWSNIDNWSFPDGQAELVYDSCLDKGVMRLYGKNESVNWDFFFSKQVPLINDKDYMHVFGFNFKSEKGGRFAFAVMMITTRGEFQLSYEGINLHNGRTLYDTSWKGLGKHVIDGNWHTVYIDIYKDFKKIFPGEDIVSINNIVFSGDGYVSDMRFYPELPEDAEITEPDILESEQAYLYDDNNGQALSSQLNLYNENGELIKYILYEYSYWDDGAKRLELYSAYNSDTNLLYSGGTEYSRDHNFQKIWVLDSGKEVRSATIARWTENLLDSITAYFNKDGSLYYVLERKDDNYRGWASGDRWYIYRRESPRNFEYGKYMVESNMKCLVAYDAVYETDYERTIRDNIVQYFSSIDIDSDEFNYEDFRDVFCWDFNLGILKKVFQEFVHENGALEYSYYTAYDSGDIMISKETRYHDPMILNTRGIWFEREEYDENAKITKKIRGRNFNEISFLGGILTFLECDYDFSGVLDGIKMFYYKYTENNELLGRLINYYDGNAKQVKAEEVEYDFWNLSSANERDIPELIDEKILGKIPVSKDNFVTDGDMSFTGYQPPWKRVGKSICKKTDVSIEDGSNKKGLLIEAIHENEGEKLPSFAEQCLPVEGNKEYKFTVDYERKTGQAHVKVYWIPLEKLFSIESTDYIVKNYSTCLVDYMDDFRNGIQKKIFYFKTPANLGVVFIRIGAASTVVYTDVDLRFGSSEEHILDPGDGDKTEDYSPPVNTPELNLVGESAGAVDSSIDSIAQKEIVYGSDYSFEVGKSTDTNVVAQEMYKNIPVAGGVLVLDKDGKIIKDNTVKVKEPYKHWLNMVRTTRGYEMHKILKEELNLTEEQIESVSTQYGSEIVIASKEENGNPQNTAYGRHIKGHGLDKIVDLENGEKLYEVKNVSVDVSANLVNKENSDVENIPNPK
jgi:hypothetical protein